MKRKAIQSDETPFAAFLLVRVRVRRVVFTDHVFRVRERVPTDAGFFRPSLRRRERPLCVVLSRVLSPRRTRVFQPGEGWVRGESSNRRGDDERDSRSMGKNFENLASTPLVVFVVARSSSSRFASLPLCLLCCLNNASFPSSRVTSAALVVIPPSRMGERFVRPR